MTAMQPDACAGAGTNADARQQYRTVESPAHHPEERCPACGARPYHFPRGLEVDGVVVYRSCIECDHAIKVERGRDRGQETTDTEGQGR